MGFPGADLRAETKGGWLHTGEQHEVLEKKLTIAIELSDLVAYCKPTSKTKDNLGTKPAATPPRR